MFIFCNKYNLIPLSTVNHNLRPTVSDKLLFIRFSKIFYLLKAYPALRSVMFYFSKIFLFHRGFLCIVQQRGIR